MVKCEKKKSLIIKKEKRKIINKWITMLPLHVFWYSKFYEELKVNRGPDFNEHGCI